MAVRSSLRSIPNIVSLSRVILAVAFVMDRDGNARIWIVLAAAVTDMLDGWLARRAGLVSRFGALVDPFADRVFGTVLCGHMVAGLVGTDVTPQRLADWKPTPSFCSSSMVRVQ